MVTSSSRRAWPADQEPDGAADLVPDLGPQPYPSRSDVAAEWSRPEHEHRSGGCDVTILSGEVTSATPNEIRAMEVIATIVGGIVVFCSDTSVCAGG